MSGKVVKIKMPARAREAEDGRSYPSVEGLPSLGKAVGVERKADHGAGASTIRAREEWVEGTRAGTPAVQARKTTTPATVTRPFGDLTIDLAAERELWQISTLMVIVPPLLGWFWLWHSTNRVLNAFR